MSLGNLKLERLTILTERGCVRVVGECPALIFFSSSLNSLLAVVLQAVVVTMKLREGGGGRVRERRCKEQRGGREGEERER